MVSYLVCVYQFLSGLGLAPDEAECSDVFGLDDELLEMVPKPVLAVLFLYPITKKVNHRSVEISIYCILKISACY